MSKEHAVRLGHINSTGLEELKRLYNRLSDMWGEFNPRDIVDRAIEEYGKNDAVIYVSFNKELLSFSSEKYFEKNKLIRETLEMSPFDMITELRNYLVNQQTEPTNDVANQGHYKNQGIEPIDYMRSTFTQDEFRGFLRGNVTKYLARHKDKNGLEDLKKAQVYLGWLIEDWEK